MSYLPNMTNKRSFEQTCRGCSVGPRLQKETNLCNGSLGLRALGSGSAATIPGSVAAATMHELA